MNPNATAELEQLRRWNMELIKGNGEWAAKFYKDEEEKKKEEVNKKAVLEIIGEQSIKIKTLERENTEKAERIAFLERENSELRLQSVTYTGRPTRDSNRLTVEDLVGPLDIDVTEDDDNSSIPSVVTDNSDASMPSLIPVQSNVLEKPPLLRMINDPNDPYGLYNNSDSVLPEIREPAEDLLASLDQYMGEAQTRNYHDMDIEYAEAAESRNYQIDMEIEPADEEAQAKVNEDQDGWLYYLKRRRIY
jgi:hypothetical protein